MKFEENDGMAAMVFRVNTIPKPAEFYPVGGMLSDGTVRGITENHIKSIKRLGDRGSVSLQFNNGLFATSSFTDEEATKIFENSNFK